MVDGILKTNGINKNWITDTARNGDPNIRNTPDACAQWCNIKSKLGFVPTSNVGGAQSKLISAKLDAFIWAKPPGESDGCSPGNGISCTRVDFMCQRDCAKPWQKCPAPEAGRWDDDMIKIFASSITSSGGTPGGGAVIIDNYPTISSGQSSLKSFHNNWLSGTPDGIVRLAPALLGWENWTWEYLGQNNGETLFAWKSTHGTYLSARNDGSVNLQPQKLGWEIWIKVDQGSFSYWKSKQWELISVLALMEQLIYNLLQIHGSNGLVDYC